jgi:hypothetical protein
MFTTWADLEKIIADYFIYVISDCDLGGGFCIMPGGIRLDWDCGQYEPLLIEVSIPALSGTRQGSAFENSKEINITKEKPGYLPSLVEHLISNGIKCAYDSGMGAAKADLRNILGL